MASDRVGYCEVPIKTIGILMSLPTERNTSGISPDSL